MGFRTFDTQAEAEAFMTRQGYTQLTKIPRGWSVLSAWASPFTRQGGSVYARNREFWAAWWTADEAPSKAAMVILNRMARFPGSEAAAAEARAALNAEAPAMRDALSALVAAVETGTVTDEMVANARTILQRIEGKA